MVSIISAQTRPGIPSGPGATSRNAIFLVASRSSSSVIRNSSLHSVVIGAIPLSSSETVAEGGPGCPAQLSRRGNRVPTTLSSSTGSIFAVSGRAQGHSLLVTILYGLPHGSDSTDSTSSVQDRAFAIFISHGRVRFASL
jgi:hypothetical protein